MFECLYVHLVHQLELLRQLTQLSELLPTLISTPHPIVLSALRFELVPTQRPNR